MQGMPYHALDVINELPFQKLVGAAWGRGRIRAAIVLSRKGGRSYRVHETGCLGVTPDAKPVPAFHRYSVEAVTARSPDA